MFNLIEKARAAAIQPPPITPIAGTTYGIKDLVGIIVGWVVYAAGALAFIYLVYGGILYITAGGDAEKATKGRTAIINAVIGLIITLLAFVIIRWVTGQSIFRP